MTTDETPPKTAGRVSHYVNRTGIDNSWQERARKNKKKKKKEGKKNCR